MQNHSRMESSLSALLWSYRIGNPKLVVAASPPPPPSMHKQVCMQITLSPVHKPAPRASINILAGSRLADTEIEFAAVISASLSRYQHFAHSASMCERQKVYRCLLSSVYNIVCFQTEFPSEQIPPSRIAVRRIPPWFSGGSGAIDSSEKRFLADRRNSISGILLPRRYSRRGPPRGKKRRQLRVG